jgi:septal ring-binding cell division protein DamX
MTHRFRGASTLMLGSGLAALLLSGCPNTAPSAPTPSASTTPSRAATPAESPSPAALTAAAIDAEACEHLNHGPILGLTAGETASESAPLVSKPHTSYDLTLPGLGKDPTYVRYSVSKAGDYVFYLDKAAELTVTDEAKATVTAKETATSAASCPSVRVRRVYPLTVGTYTLQIGPTGDASVSFVAIATDDPGHEP